MGRRCDVIKSKIKPNSFVYTEHLSKWQYSVSDVKNFRINHSKEFANNHNHINDIENFWFQSKRMLDKYSSIDKKHFYLF